MNKAFFLDKDGTIVDYFIYGRTGNIPTDELMVDNVVEGLKLIQNKGYLLLIVSNQRWIGDGEIEKEVVEKGFYSLIKKLEEFGIKINDFIYCPHSKGGGCECRKPGTKMFKDLIEKHDIDIDISFVVGDTEKDILAGRQVGVKTIFVKSGGDKLEDLEVKPDFVLENLNEVDKVI
tara:strand:- start:722 stop:1249 length:528 start_codon:yes stop_codon:yes gene_type:complete